jgi:hypothetical protein
MCISDKQWLSITFSDYGDRGVSKMLDSWSELMWLVTQEDFIAFSCNENLLLCKGTVYNV